MWLLVKIDNNNIAIWTQEIYDLNSLWKKLEIIYKLNYMLVDNYEELQLYVKLLESQNKLKYKDFETLIKDLKYEFNINVTEEQLNNLYSSTIEEEAEDLRMIYDRIQ